jgi:ubiquitin-like-conjugating enzyme ATG10
VVLIESQPHPITDVPAFFTHPCQTKEAMENFDCQMANYLMVWLGLVGDCVGLWVPPEMAAEEA